MLETGFVTHSEYQKHIRGEWRTVHDLWRHIRNYMTSYAQPGGFTPGSVAYGGADGFLTENNANFYYDAANHRLGLGTSLPAVAFHIKFPAVEVVESRLSAKTRPWRQWECIDGNWGLAIGIHADDGKMHFNYDVPIGTRDTSMIVFDGPNARVGIQEDAPAFPLDIGVATRIQSSLQVDTTLGVTGDTTLSKVIVTGNAEDGLNLTSTSSQIHFIGAAGEKGICYRDTGDAQRYAMMFPDASDVVHVLNRAANGTVEIHANTAVAGAGGDVLVAEFQDDIINLSVDLAIRSQKELRFYDNGNYVGFEAPALGADQIWVLPAADGPANEVIGTDNAGNLIWRTHDELAGYVAGEHMLALDEDDMASDSDTNVATQQSVKAYVDAQVAGVNEFIELTDTPADYAGQALNALRCTGAENGLEWFTIVDQYVKVDAAAASGHLGVAAGDGVLRTGANITVADGGNFITLDTVQNIGTGASPTFTGLNLTSELDMTGVAACIDLNPAGTGTKNIIDITPSASLIAGRTWHGVYIAADALDPATGDPCVIHGFHFDATGLASVDHDGNIVGFVTTAPVEDSFTGFSATLRELTQNKTQDAFRAFGGTPVLSGTGTYNGLFVDWDGITRDGGAPVLHGVQVLLPGDYSDFGVSYAGYFEGDGRSVTICDTTYALDVSGLARFTALTITDIFSEEHAVDHNLFLGHLAGSSIAGGGQSNILIGEEAGTSISTGDNSICIGRKAGYYFTTTGNNIYIGLEAGRGTIGNNQASNVAIGTYAMRLPTTSSNCVALGYGALQQITSGSYNMAIGSYALNAISTQTRNVAIGSQAGMYYVHQASVMIGYFAGSGSVDSGLVAVGDSAGRGKVTGGANFTYCTFVGHASAGNATCVGACLYNTAIGAYSLYSLSTADNCTVIGYKAGEDITSGSGNVCLGYMAGSGQITNQNNKLYIANSNTATPLIYGEFDTPLLKVTGEFDVVGASKLGDGGTTNYAETKADGEINLHGTARVTKQIYLNNAAFTKGATAPTQVILGNLNAWEFDIGDDAVMTAILPPDWAAGTLITIKVCWYIDEAYAADKEIQWRVDWSALPHDFSEAVDAPTHSGQIDSGDIDIPAVAKRMGVSTIGTIAGANLSAGDMLGFTLSRIAVTNDDPTADPAIHHLIIEYTADKLGTAT